MHQLEFDFPSPPTAAERLELVDRWIAEFDREARLVIAQRFARQVYLSSYAARSVVSSDTPIEP